MDVELDSRQRELDWRERGALLEQDSRRELLRAVAPSLSEVVRTSAGRCWAIGGPQPPGQPPPRLVPLTLALPALSLLPL